MGGVANFPFPSFTLLLTSDRVIIPGPSYVIRYAPLTDYNVNSDLVEDHYPLANLDFENDSITHVALGHCDSEESLSTVSVQNTHAGSGQAGEEVGAGIKFHFPFLKTLPTVHIQVKKIFRRLSQFKLNGGL